MGEGQNEPPATTGRETSGTTATGGAGTTSETGSSGILGGDAPQELQ